MLHNVLFINRIDVLDDKYPSIINLHLFLFNHFDAISKQTYVQDLAAKEADAIYKLIVEESGHVYVCGDVTMAEHVYQTIRYVELETFITFYYSHYKLHYL